MDKKSIMSRKTLKIVLGICIVAVIAAVAGLFGYTYMADHNTLGRKISVNGLVFQIKCSGGRRQDCCFL